jgi:hypothetical protein
MLAIKVKQEEVDEVLNECLEAEDTGHSKFPGMSYEQGGYRPLFVG